MGGIGGMESGRMKVVLRTGVGRGEVTEESGERRGESWKFYKFGMMGLKRVLEKDFEAFSSANLMKMRCRSDWDASRGLKPSKMGQKCDFARKIFFSRKKILLLFQRDPNKLQFFVKGRSQNEILKRLMALASAPRGH